MEVRRLIFRTCIISMPTGVSEAVWNQQIISRTDTKMRPSTEDVKNPPNLVTINILDMVAKPRCNSVSE